MVFLFVEWCAALIKPKPGHERGRARI